jgi:hypothetical protein
MDIIHWASTDSSVEVSFQFVNCEFLHVVQPFNQSHRVVKGTLYEAEAFLMFEI